MVWGILAAIIFLLGTLPLWLFASALWSIVTFFYACFEMLSPMLGSDTATWDNYAMAPLYAFVQSVIGAIAVPVWLGEWASMNPWWAMPIGLVAGYVAAKKL